MAKVLHMCLLLAAAGPEPKEPAKLPASPAFHEARARISPWARNIWIDGNAQGRRVLLRAAVCLRRGILEEFLCLRGTKEHESILAADLEARQLHAALLLAGAEAGRPATFHPEFRPPTGDVIELWVEWKQGQEFKRMPAQKWVRDGESGKAVTHHWVFAGSRLVENPITKKPYYLGNDGDLISVANFPGSVIDLAIRSSNANQELLFEAFTERIPPEDTEVFVILKPVPRQKAKQPANLKVPLGERGASAP